MGVWDYSTTAGNNANVSGQNWAEGQAPSTLNDSARKLLADLAEQYQLYGGLLTTAGSANAQTLTPTVAWTSYNDGARLLVQIGNSLTNTGSATLNVSSLGAKTIYRRDGSTTLLAGDLAAGSFCELIYDATVNGFRLLDGLTLDDVTLDSATAAGSDVASASTTDLSAATGGIVDVTGTTTITAITLPDGDIRFVRFTGALTLTHGSSLVLPGAANITTAAGDWAIFVGDASSVVRCAHYQRADGKPLVTTIAVADMPAGAIIGSDYAEGTTHVTSNSVPANGGSVQITEGAEVLTLTYTPKRSDSKLRLRFRAMVSASTTATQVIISLHTGGSGIAHGYATPPANNQYTHITIEHQYEPGSTDAITFSIRLSTTLSGTAAINGNTSSKFGDSKATLVVEEVKS